MTGHRKSESFKNCQKSIGLSTTTTKAVFVYLSTTTNCSVTVCGKESSRTQKVRANQNSHKPDSDKYSINSQSSISYQKPITTHYGALHANSTFCHSSSSDHRNMMLWGKHWIIRLFNFYVTWMTSWSRITKAGDQVKSYILQQRPLHASCHLTELAYDI